MIRRGLCIALVVASAVANAEPPPRDAPPPALDAPPPALDAPPPALDAPPPALDAPPPLESAHPRRRIPVEGSIGGASRNITVVLWLPYSTPAFMISSTGADFSAHRVVGKLRVGPVTGELHYEHTLAIVGASDLADASTRLFLGPTDSALAVGDVLPLQGKVLDAGGVVWRHRVDRARLQLSTRWFDLSVGRQPVSYGVGVLLPQLDVLTSFPATQIDRTYKPGVDSAVLTIPLRATADIELTYAAYGTGASEQAAIARGRATISIGELGVLGGLHRRDGLVGLYATTDLRGTVVRAEGSYTRAQDDPQNAGDPLPPARNVFRALVGADHRFGEHWFVSGEYAFNGFGSVHAGQYLGLLNSARAQRGELWTFGEHELALLGSWTPRPTLNVSLLALFNPADPSVLFSPSLRYAPSECCDIAISGFLPAGRFPDGGVQPRSEFGTYPLALISEFRVFY